MNTMLIKLVRKILWAVLVVLAGAMTFPATGYSYVLNGIEIIPRVSVRETYDSNITTVKDNAIEDYITSLSAGVSLKGEEKTRRFSLDVDVVRQLFAKNSSFNNTAEYAQANYSEELSKSGKLTLSDAFSHATEATSFENAFGRTNGRFSTYENEFKAGYHHDMTEQLFWTARYMNDLVDFSRKDLSDSMVNAAGVGAGYALDSVTSVELDYDFSRRDFDPGSAVTFNEFSGLLRHYLTKQLYLDVQAGVDLINPAISGHLTKPLFRVALTEDINETTRTGIAFEKRYISTAYSQDVVDDWRVSGNYTKDLTSRITGSVTAFYGNGRYIVSDITDKLAGVKLGGSYDLTRNSKFNLNYIFTDSTSNIADRGYTRNEVLLGISMEF